MKTYYAILIACCVLCFVPMPVLAAAGSGVENVTAQFADSAQKWENTIKGHAVKLFWILASIAAAWTFAVLVMRQADLADLIGAVVRFVFVTWFFYWILDNGAGFAQKILASTQQIGDEAAGTNGLDYGAFAKMGLDVLIQVNSHITLWQPAVASAALLLAILILIALGLVTVNIILVTAETWIVAYAGLIFLGFGAAEWTRDNSVNYYKTILAYGIKLMVTLLLAGIGLDILRNVQAQAGQGWGTELMPLGKALIAAAILLGIIGKAPGAVAGITGVSTSGAGGHGWTSFLGGAFTAATIASGAGAAAAQGGKQLGQAVRNAVKQGQALSRGRP
jgi:type IV secretion system protein TrbL